ncbi:peptidoglycan-binding protein [Mangrovicella endophytica]|uniref:peptidoglycan-binding protein n=1 Tax=Mangrovicella endophytica TaxID=2066697 RepID=UPI000C9DF245|nr:peptidoglycan-binding protein [Mangrovicella endophytica]
MAEPRTAAQVKRSADEPDVSLASLNRTLEQLESRLSRLTLSKGVVSPAPSGRITEVPGEMAAQFAGQPSAPTPAPRPSLSDAVSEIAMRRQMLEREGEKSAGAAAAAADLRDIIARHSAPAPRPTAPVAARPAQADIEALKSDGVSYALMASVTAELQQLRATLKSEVAERIEPRFDDMRTAFDELRQLVADQASPDTIDAEISRVDRGLVQMVDGGADPGMVEALRHELRQMRQLVAQTAREDTLQSVGRRWDDLATSISGKAEEETRAKQDLKAELERLRESLGGLASEDHIKAVERRWDDFETRYLDRAAPDGDQLSDLLQKEMQALREKLETLASERSIKAVEERWGQLEERFASRDIEAKIEAMAARMEQLETALAKLPETLPIAPLEQRIHSLALSIEQLLTHQPEHDIDHFVALEERLDEISRAIVSNARQAPAQLDMAPIERIEARIAALTARVDQIAQEGDAELLSQRVSELAQRVEALSFDGVSGELAARLSDFSDRLERLLAEAEQPRVDVEAIEGRLSDLAARIESGLPQVDEALVRSLEAQIAKLSQQVGTIGGFGSGGEVEFDERLAAIERRLDENRDALIASAKAAADEAVERMLEIGAFRESEHVEQLSQDLRSLEALARQTDERAGHVFEAVHGTLQKIVQRLDQMDRDFAGASHRNDVRESAPVVQAAAAPAVASAAAAAEPPMRGADVGGLRNAISRRLNLRDAAAESAGETAGDVLEGTRDETPEEMRAPSLDAADFIDTREANRPLEIGSGAPDIAALLNRVRAQQSAGTAEVDPAVRADFRAAAKRAAVAAAAEAESLRSNGSEEGGRVSLSEAISRRRKPILMAVGAVLLALMAMPLGRAFLAQRPDAVDEDAGVQIEEPATPMSNTTPAEAPAASSSEIEDAAPVAPAAPAASEASVKPPLMPVATPPQQPSAIAPAAPESTTPAANAGPAGTAAPSGTPAMAPSASPQPSSAMTAPTGSAPVADAAPLASALSAASPAGSKVAGAGEAALPTAPAASSTDAGLLASATAKLPAATRMLPAVPDGIGTPALTAAANGGDPKAIFEVGLRIMEGRAGEPDASAALPWFAKAATAGFAPAQYSLGTLFEKGNGVTRDLPTARDWYLLAADQGNVRAMHNLAVLYATGIDGKSEPETAVKWFSDAAAYGMRDSQYNLGILFARGSGVEQNLEASYRWFSIVARAGDKDAEEKRQELAKSLPAETVKAADAAVANWQPKARVEEANTVQVPDGWDKPSDQTSSIDMKRAIRNVQAILIKLGYEPGVPDGVIGEKTTEAIIAFQKKTGLTPNGQIDEPLIRALLQRKDA